MKRAVIVICDSLRADLITPQDAPFLSEFGGRSARFANHRAYFEWFEEARNRYLEAVGLAPLSSNAPGPVIAETGIRYHRPLAYADEILVGARTVRLGNTSFDMEYAVWRDGLCALGRAVLILVVNATGEKTPLPPELRESILALDPGVQ